MKRKCVALSLIGTIAVGTAAMMGRSHENGLVVHEWGTFTSLQGSDGVPLQWNPLESSRLPGFVYDWSKAGLGRYPSGMLMLGLKHVLVTLQRMETPVIYFYTDKEQAVDLTVRFPKGGITEWYPQAPQIGPSRVPPGPLTRELDSGLHHIGVSQNFSMESVLGDNGVKESLIHWPNLKILPSVLYPDMTEQLPQDTSGSHYFAARETDSAYVQDFSSSTNGQPEREKFLFYRGVGNFSTPLTVQMKSDNAVTLINNGQRGLSHLFILNVHEQAGSFACLDDLKAGEQKELSFDSAQHELPLTKLREEIGAKMANALTSQGLYSREASAMVKTWDDSWFQEKGVRVLYVLPRAWTDEILPMQIQPKPKELVRVMVGRAELITPETERKLTFELTQARAGHSEAPAEIRTMIKELGRFAEPVFGQALARTEAQGDERNQLLALLYQARQNGRN